MTWANSARDDPLKGFKRFDPPFAFECCDIWPPGTLTARKRAAYDEVARRGDILPRGVRRLGDGRIEVRYVSKMPAEWMRDELGKIESNMQKRS